MKSATAQKNQFVNYVNPETGSGCAVCGGPLKRGAKTYCGLACYRLVQRSIDPTARFWSKVNRTEGCWLWTGSRSGGNQGRKYGQFTYTVAPGQQRHVSAHVYSYEIAYGPVPDGLEVLHICNTGLCLRPDHLKAGTHQQNVADAVKDGLYIKRDAKGRKPRKLTDAQVEQIVALAKDMLQYRIAEQFGVSKTCNSLILKGMRRQRVTQSRKT